MADKKKSRKKPDRKKRDNKSLAETVTDAMVPGKFQGRLLKGTADKLRKVNKR